MRTRQTGRYAFYAKQNRAAQRSFKAAADKRFPEGAPSENVQAYPMLLRAPYVFPPDPNETTPEEAIQQSGCQTISEEL